jgi:hypothetical protein
VLNLDTGHRMGLGFLGILSLWRKASPVFGFLAFAYLFLSYFEAPRSITLLSESQCLGIEAAILFIFSVNAAFHIYAYSPDGPRSYFGSSSLWRIAELLVLSLNIIDAILYAYKLGQGEPDFPRFSRLLRPFYTLNLSDATRDQGKLILITIATMAPKVLVLIGFVGVWATLGFCLFFTPGPSASSASEEAYFADYYSSFIGMFVCMTTSNFPDIMLPAMRKHRGYVAFFMAYLITGTLVGLNIILGFNYTVFRDERDAADAADAERSKKALSMAFSQLADPRSHSILRSRFLDLFLHFRPEMSATDGDAAFNKMDTDGSGTIDAEEFAVLADTLFLSYSPPAEEAPSTWPRVWLALHSQAWAAVMGSAVLASGIISVWTLQVGTAVFQPRWPFFADLFLLAIFVADVVLKIVSLGLRRFAGSGWGVADLMVVAISVAAKIGIEVVVSQNPALFPGGGDGASADYSILRVACIFRSLKVFAALSVVRPLRHLSDTIITLAPQLLKFVVVIGLLFYAFAAVGVEAFKGVLADGNPSLEGSDYLAFGYHGELDFDSFANALITLFVLLMTNNWHVFLDGLSRATTRFAALYSILFYLVVVVVILNLTVAFLLDSVAFNLAIIKARKDEKMKRSQELLSRRDSRFLSAQPLAPPVPLEEPWPTRLGRDPPTASESDSEESYYYETNE